MDTEKNVLVGNEELQKSLEYMQGVLSGNSKTEEPIKKADTSFEQANGGQPNPLATQLSTIAKGIGDLAKSMSEFQKSATERMDAMQKAMDEKSKEPGDNGVPPEGKEKEEKDKEKPEENFGKSELAEMMTLMKSFGDELAGIKSDLDNPIRRSAKNIATLKKSFGAEEEGGNTPLPNPTQSKRQLADLFAKAYVVNQDEQFLVAASLVETGGRVSKSTIDELQSMIDENKIKL
jgi:hypothetical protein